MHRCNASSLQLPRSATCSLSEMQTCERYLQEGARRDFCALSVPIFPPSSTYDDLLALLLPHPCKVPQTQTPGSGQRLRIFSLHSNLDPSRSSAVPNLGSPMCVARCRWLSITEQLLPGPGLPCGVRERGALYDPISIETIQACRHPAFLLQAAS